MGKTLNGLVGWGGLLGMALGLLSGCGGSDGSDPPVTPLPDPQAMFSWSTQQKVIGFSNSAALFPVQTMAHGSVTYPLPMASGGIQKQALQATYQYGSNADGSAHTGNTVNDFMTHNQVTGLLVIKNGQIVLEKYAMGINAATLWDGKSVSKSVTSTLMGAAIKDGYIGSLNDPVDNYVPELKGSAYEGVSLRNMLHMSSGVVWNENELDPTADLPALLRCVDTVGDNVNCVLNLMKTRPHAIDPSTGLPAAPGAIFNYSTGEAFLSGLAIQRATGMSLASYLQKKIWQPFGMQSNGNWWTWNGVSFGAGGFNATLRDYGRFGLFVLNNGVLPDGTHVLPDNWITDATTWTANSALPGYADNGQYGYMWWFSPAYDDDLVGGTNQASPIFANVGAPLQNTDNPAGAIPVQERAPVQGQQASVSDWTFAAIGIYGQMIAINQRENLVVVQWSVWDKPSPTCCNPADPEYVASDPYNEQSVYLNALLIALH